jgi:hypothetical protein
VFFGIEMRLRGFRLGNRAGDRGGYRAVVTLAPDVTPATLQVSAQERQMSVTNVARDWHG